MPLGMEVGLSPGHIVLDGDPVLPRKGAQQPPPPLFGPCLLWPWSPISATAELLYLLGSRSTSALSTTSSVVHHYVYCYEQKTYYLHSSKYEISSAICKHNAIVNVTNYISIIFYKTRQREHKPVCYLSRLFPKTNKFSHL